MLKMCMLSSQFLSLFTFKTMRPMIVEETEERYNCIRVRKTTL